jgi:hypothetical protein
MILFRMLIVIQFLITPVFSAEIAKPAKNTVKLDQETFTPPKNIKFSSTYTNLKTACKDKFSDSEDGHDMPVICNGPGGYWIDVEFSACCEQLLVADRFGFLLPMPEQRIGTFVKRKLEWRLANGKPFAVIFRIDKYKGDITLSPEKTCEVLQIKGLGAFTGIDYEVSQKDHPNPNQEARQLADLGYLRLRHKTINTKQSIKQ